MNSISISESKEFKISNEVTDYLNPDYLFIPLDDSFTLMVSDDNRVFKEQVLLKKDGKTVYSPVSGRVLGGTESMKGNDENLKCIVIENDFKEKVNHKKGVTKYINKYSKGDFLKYIKKYNAFEYNIDENANILVVSGIDVDPFEKTFSLLVNNESAKILETIDAMLDILNIETAIFCINENDSENVINLTNNIGTYPDIKLKLLPDIYPIGFKEVLLDKVLSKKDKEKGYIYMNVEEIFAIYNVLRRKKPITEKLVTISGNAIEQPKVINVKIGTSINEIIKNCVRLKTKKYYVVINGLLSGKTINTLNNVVTTDTRSIMVATCDESKEMDCINCGLCTKLCPVGLNPKYLKEHKKADRSKCIHCNLCTYICPAKINFKKCLGDKDEK